MNKLSISSISSLNYLFLKEAFSAEGIFCHYVLGELEEYLTNLSSDCTEQVEDIIKEEMIEGTYFDDLALDQIRTNFERGINRVFDCECEAAVSALNKYLDIATDVFNNHLA